MTFWDLRQTADADDAAWVADDDRGSGSRDPSVVVACVSRPEQAASDPMADFWQHLPSLRGYLRRRVPAADIDDVMQDVLLKIIRRGDVAVDFHKCYLLQTAQAALVDRHRRQTARHHAQHCELSESAHPIDEISPLRILIGRDDIRAAEDVLRRLPTRTREIVVGVRIEGLSLKSLASRYNISISAIEKHVSRGLKALSAIRPRDVQPGTPGCPPTDT